MKLLDIPLSEAFKYCFTQHSYVIGLIVATLVAIVIIYVTIKKMPEKTLIGIFIALLMWSIFLMARPEDVSTNTTPEQAAKGVFIG